MIRSIKTIIFISLLILTNLHASSVNLTQKEKNFIKNHPTITLGAGNSWEPVVIQNHDGSISGYNTDILKLINEATGANFIQKVGDWVKIQNQVENKEIDGFSTAIQTKKRDEFLNFSEVYISAQKMLLVKEGNPNKIKTKEDLSGKTIVITKGNRADENAANQFQDSTIIYTNTRQETAEMVIYGKADATFGNGATSYMLSKLGLPLMENIFAIDQSLDLRFAVRKDWPEAISILEKGLASIPEYQRILLKQKWLFSPTLDSEKQIDFTNDELAYLKEKQTISMCIDPDWMPFESLDTNGNHIGISADYFKIFQNMLPINIEVLQTKSWGDSLEKIRNRHCDILSLAMATHSRAGYLNFTSPYIEVPLVIATKIDIPFINDIASLKNKKVGITKEYAFAGTIQAKYPNLSIVEVDNIEDGLKKVDQGELYGFIGTLASVSNVFQKGHNGLLKISGEFTENLKLSIAVRSDDPELLNIFEKVIQNVDLEKQKKILDDWISLQYTQHIDYSLLWQLLGLFFIIGVVSFYWMRKISKANKTIQTSLDNFQYFFDNTIETIGLFQNDKCIDINEAAIKLFEFNTKEDAIGLSPFDFIAPQSIQKVQEMIQENSIHSYEAYATKQDGTIFPVLIKAYYKKLYGINTRVVCLIDLTEIKQKEKAIIITKNKVEALNQEFQLMLDSIMEGVGIFENNICIDLNNIALDMFGYRSKDQLLGSNPLVFIDEEFHERALQAISSNNPDPYEINGRKKDGTIIPLMIKAFTLETKFRTIRIVSAIDLTDTKEKENTIELAKNKALEASQTKSEFLANMSHEIRTPINGITGMTRLALQTDLDEKQKHYLTQIQSSTKNLLLIINDILDFSKIEAGKLNIDKINFNLKQLITSVTTMIKPQADEKGLDFKVFYEDDLCLDLYADSLRISQVLINLLNNAIKFTASGYVHIEIKAIDNRYIFTIKDSGIGMTEQQQSKLFLPFAQADGSTTRKHGGTGLGLSISKQLIELMGGKIYLHSQLNIGSNFTFELALEKSINEIAIEKEELTSLDSLDIQDVCKILLIDDNKVNQEIVIGLLSHPNIKIDTASNGKEGIELYHQNRSQYDLIFMDLQMPIMDGFEATKIIRADNKDIPIIALTANAMNHDIKSTKKHGMNEHLNKPIEVEKFYKTLLLYIPNKVQINNSIIDIQKVQDEEKQIYNFEHINTQAGLSHMAENKKLYHKILNDFYNKYKELRLEDLNTEELQLTLHTIKGLSANVGAMSLSDIAKKLEESLDATLFDLFHKELDQVLDEIKNSHILDPKNNPITLLEISPDKRDELFKQIKEFATKRRVQKCNDIITQLNQYNLQVQDKEILSKIKKLLIQRDYKTIMEIL